VPNYRDVRMEMLNETVGELSNTMVIDMHRIIVDTGIFSILFTEK